MATLDSIINPGVSEEVDPTFKAGRVSIRPLEHQTLQGKVLGHYSAYSPGAIITPVANAIMGGLRWTDPTNLCVLMRLYVTITVVTAITTAQRTDPIVGYFVRPYTTFDSTGAGTFTLTGNNYKMRTSMATTLMGNLAVATAAAGMTGGSGMANKDANPFGGVSFGPSALGALGTGQINTDLWRWNLLGQHPFVIQQNEGVIVAWGVSSLSTGSISVGIGFDWAEVSSF